MSPPAHPEWPDLLRAYEAAIAEFDSVSSALTATLMTRSVADEDVRSLLATEERARETVILARMRLINLWRETQAEQQAALPEPPSAAATPKQ